MEKFKVACHTDVGIKKATNQDSIALKVISDGENEILLAVLCDGMGGMAKGELASATVIRAFSEWFEQIFTEKGIFWTTEDIKQQWKALLTEANIKLIQYGKENSIMLGTTATVILIFPERRYLIGHIGDTRIYRITHTMEQLTEDHTYVAREIRRGNMTAEQALSDNRRNVLLQCIGVNEQFDAQFAEGQLAQGDGVLLCSDGLRHVVTEQELYEHLKQEYRSDTFVMKRQLQTLVELNKARLETDNISAILIDIN